MKRVLSVMLVLVMLAAVFTGAAAADAQRTEKICGDWAVGEYVDEFDDPTGETYVYSTAEGKYSNTAVTNSPMTAVIYYLGSTFDIRLLENGSRAATYYDKSEITLKIKVDDVIYTYTLSSVNAPNGDISVSNSDAYQQMITFMNQGKDIRCVLTIDNSKYSFTISSNGFSNLVFSQPYAEAAALMEAGKYEEAYAAYTAMRGYKDVDTLLATDENMKAVAAAALAAYDVGNIVTMGNYGGEAVEWLVLAAEGDTRTMITVKGQDAVCFNKSSSDGNQWSTSNIRTWLNETYYNAAFSAEEQAMITAGPTGDKVWLLSVEEAKQYFADNAARVCYHSEYAKKNGAWTNDSGAGWWWLRSPGSHSYGAASVISLGGINSRGNYVDYSDGLARPVVVVSAASVGLLTKS